GPITHRAPVVDDGGDSDRAAGAEPAVVRFERAVLQRVALDSARLIEDAVVTDRGESPVRDVESIIENPLADPDAHQPPDHGLEWRAVERVEIHGGRHLPEALVQPEVRVVDGADRRPQRAEPGDAAVHQRVVQPAGWTA